MLKRACKSGLVATGFILFAGLFSLALSSNAIAQDVGAIEPIVGQPVSEERAEEQAGSPQPNTPVAADYSSRSIDQIDLSMAPKYSTPKLRPVPTTGANVTGPIIVKAYTWTAPNDTYKNLMFEDPLLERHGFSRNERLQPVVSGFKFFKAGFLFPLDVVKGYHNRCDNPLGWVTPGSLCR